MHSSKQIAKHLKEVYFGGNWTWSNVKEQVSTLTWQQATTQVYGFNSIATLCYHSIYFVRVINEVLLGNPLVGNDKESFSHPPIHNQEDWNAFLEQIWLDAEKAVSLIEQVPEEYWQTIFFEEKYGNYYRNIVGCIEHIHYHLGQISLVKKIILSLETNPNSLPN